MATPNLAKGHLGSSLRLVFCFTVTMIFASLNIAQAQSGERQSRREFLTKALDLKSNTELENLLKDFLEKRDNQPVEQGLPGDHLAKNYQLIITNGSGMVLIGSEPARLNDI